MRQGGEGEREQLSSAVRHIVITTGSISFSPLTQALSSGGFSVRVRQIKRWLLVTARFPGR